MTRTGTEQEQIVLCPICNYLLTPNVAVSTTTPGLELGAVVFANVPCECGRVARVLFRFGGANEEDQ